MKKLLHWVVCHNVLLVLLVFLVVAVIFREPLFGIKASKFESDISETNSVVSVQEIPEKTQPEQSQPESTSKQPVPDPVESPVIKAETADEIQLREQYEFRPPEELVVEAVVDEGLLQQARKAYWNDQLDSAKKLYLAYIELDPTNPDGYGELGNLLSTMGELDEAAEMYRQAADLLSQQGKAEEAEQLLKVLDSIRVIQTTNQ